jgi:hypothetical protein
MLPASTSLPYKEREEWKDISPVPQDDGPSPVCAINYTNECKFELLCCRSRFLHVACTIIA